MKGAPELDEQLCFALYAASRALTRAYAPMLDSLGLTYPQLLVMMVLWEEDGVGVAQIGERLRLDSGTLTPLLKRLESAELLRRERDTEDERRLVVSLTSKGRRLGPKAGRAQRELICRFGDVASVADLRDALKDLLAKIDAQASEA